MAISHVKMVTKTVVDIIIAVGIITVVVIRTAVVTIIVAVIRTAVVTIIVAVIRVAVGITTVADITKEDIVSVPQIMIQMQSIQ